MKEFYAQKELPDIIIGEISLDCLSDFNLYFDSEDCIEIICTSPVLPANAKNFFLKNGALGKKMQIIEPTRRYSDGADVDIPMIMVIKHYAFNYTLSADGEPTNYCFTFKCEYYG
jgi:hypothetical protein